MGILKTNTTELIIHSKDDAIVHGCNTKGIMGVGAAELVKKTYDVEMFKKYVQACDTEIYKPGDIQVYQQNDLPILYNLAIQSNIGKKAKIEYVTSSLEKALKDMQNKNIQTFSITPMGTFHGGLDKEETIHEIRKLVEQSDFTATMYLRKQVRTNEQIRRVQKKYF